MNKEDKKRLKKLGKEIVKERGQQLREALLSTNSAEFSSDQYVRNEIEIRKREKLLRQMPSVKSVIEAEKDYLLLPADKVGQQQSFGSDLYWLCKVCNVLVPSEPNKPENCYCQNIYLEPIQFEGKFDSGVSSIQNISEFKCKDSTKLELLKLFPKI